MATAVCGRLETDNPVRALRPIRNRRGNGIRRRPITVDRRGSSPDYVGQTVAATGDCGWRYRLCATLFFYLNRPKAGESCHACRFL